MKEMKLLEVARLRSIIQRLRSQYGDERAMQILREALEAELRVWKRPN